MKTAIWVLVLLTLVNRITAKVSLTDLGTCEEYTANKKFGYQRHDLNKLNMANVSDGNELVRLKFFVQGPKDARILLENSRPDEIIKGKDKYYEIGIGAYDNSFSFMRLQQNQSFVTETRMSNTMSESHVTQIEIIQTRGKGTEGKLIVNLIGMDEPHMVWTDSNRLDVTHVGIGTGWGPRVKWWFNCKFNSSETDGIKMEERKLPDDLRLIKHLSPNRKTHPAVLKNITLDFVLEEVVYNHNMGILSTRISLFMTWFDSRLQWKPSDYGNLTFFKSYIFWTPKLCVNNGVGASLKAVSGYFQSTIYHNGTVTAHNIGAQIDSMCPEDDGPDNSIECRIEISVTNSDARLLYGRQSRAVPSIQDLDVKWISVKVPKKM